MQLHPCLVLLSITSITIAQNESPPKMELANQGWIQGKLLKTVGNLDNEPRTIYTYRNIPYADHSEFLRFQQSVPHTKSLGTKEDPYDAGPTGPLCAQGGLDEEGLTNLTNIAIQDTVAGVISDIVPIPGIGIIADNIAEQVIEALNLFFEIEIGETTTIGELLEDWLDVKLAVSEECLHLAVYTPRSPTEAVLELPKEELLPIMFFVHGGGFTSGFQLQMDAARLGEVADVIVVAINYRLGPLGFLCLDTDEGAGNMGMLDQVMALEWVHENIHLFGGDKDRITIFGESAGAASIGHLVMSKATDLEDGTGLFAQGIGQSGSATAEWAFDTEPTYNSLAVARNAGCGWDNETHTEIVECLRGRDVANITSAFSRHSHDEMLRGKLGFGGTNPCGQTAGKKKFYTAFENPRDLLINGEYRHIPVFFGANSHEGSYVYTVVWDDYIVPLKLNDSVEYWSGPYMYDLLAILGISEPNVVGKMLEDMYFYDWQIGSQEDMTPGIVDFGGGFMLKAPGYQMVEENSKYNPSYFYQINHSIRKSIHYLMEGDTPYLRNADLGLPGTTHGDEMMYMFNVPLPIVLCPLDDFISAMIGALQECQDSGQDALCFAYENSTFKEEWNDCIWGEMKPDEQILSDRIVKAWTNFATYGSPTPNQNDPDLPYIEAFNIANPSYLDFTHDGVIPVMESFINALPYQKGGATNAEADRCDKSGSTGLNKVAPAVSSLGLISLVISFLSR